MCYRPNYVVAKTYIAFFLGNMRYVYDMMNNQSICFWFVSILFIRCIVYVFILSPQKSFARRMNAPKRVLSRNSE